MPAVNGSSSKADRKGRHLPRFLGRCCLVAAFALAGCRTGKRDKKPTEPPPPPTFPGYTGERLKLPQRRRPLEDFERTAQLTTSSATGQPYLLKNTEQAIWGSAAAEIRFVPKEASAHLVRVTPESPWQMPSLFDNISLWIRDEGEGAVSGGHAVSVRLRDARGYLQEIRLPYTPEPGWQMLHQRVLTQFPLPIQVEEILWNLPEGTQQPRRILLEGLTFYQEVLSRIPTRTSYVRPHGYAPAFAPVQPNSVTLNFPTSDLAFLPKASSDRIVVSLEQRSQQQFDFICTSPGARVIYRVHAEDGGPSVSLVDDLGNEVPVWTGPELLGMETAPTVRFSRMRDNELLLQYTDGIGINLSISGKTLVVTLETLREDVAGMALGSVTGNQTLFPPFLHTGVREAVPIWYTSRGDQGLFISLIPDWWASMASSYRHDPSPSRVGTFFYEPRWRGSRNLFRERIYLTAAEQLSAVIPSVAAPQGLYYNELQEVNLGPDLSKTSFPILRLQPSDPEWEDQWLARTPEGEWLFYPDGDGVVMKSALAELVVIPRILALAEREGSQDGYLHLPEVTQHGPWRFTDADQRVVGAGTFAQTYADLGALFQQAEAELGKPLVGSGGAEWLWAGLVSGFVPKQTEGIHPQRPLLPQVAWQSIRPSSRLFGVGEASLFRLEGETEAQRPVWVDRSLAYQLAYGAPGIFPETGIPEWKAERSRLLLLLLQRALTGRHAERFAYSDGTTLLSTAEAMRTGALSRNQLYIRLNDQTEIWINGSLSDSWNVRVEEHEWDLPPFGFVLRGPETFLVHLPSQDGLENTIVARSAEFRWVSSPGKEAEYLGITLKGCLRLRQTGPGERHLEFMDWSGRAVISPEALGLKKIGTIRAVDPGGHQVSDVRMLQENGNWVLRSEKPLKSVWIYERIQGEDRNFSP